MVFRIILVSFFLIVSQGVYAVKRPFVTVLGHQFYVNGKPYYYIGANYWYGGLLRGTKNGAERLRRELDFLKAQGVTNVRVLAGSEGLGLINGVERVKPALQPKRGQFNEKVLEGLDYLLYELAKRKMYAVMILSNNWEWSGGFLQYLNWRGVLPTEVMRSKMNWDDLRDHTSRFYSCRPCQEDYEKQVKLILNHYNKYSKRPYKEEPAIMAWELANEPRPMRPSAVDNYIRWTSSVAALIKTMDKNHLVTLGTEGIMGTEESSELFKKVHIPKEVDYLTLHIWPKNWQWFRDTSIVDSLPRIISRSVNYVKKHVSIAEELNKPLVIEEFGLPRDAHSFAFASTTVSRDHFYEAIFGEWQQSRLANGVIAGCNFWSFAGMSRSEGQLFWKEGDDFTGDPPQEEQGLNSVFDSDSSTWRIIRAYALQNYK